MHKKIIGTLLIATMVLGTTGKTCLAVEKGITGNVTKTLAKGTYTHGTYGSPLRMDILYEERHKTTGDLYTDTHSNSVVGQYLSVTASKAADEGYNFTKATFNGYANGKKQLSTGTINAS